METENREVSRDAASQGRVRYLLASEERIERSMMKRQHEGISINLLAVEPAA